MLKESEPQRAEGFQDQPFVSSILLETARQLPIAHYESIHHLSDMTVEMNSLNA